MVDLLTAEEMREIEADAMESGRASGLELMERAGRGAVEAILETWPDLDRPGACVRILCGPGNNGGDGFVVARLLAARGWSVGVFLLGSPDLIGGDARTNLDRWRTFGPVGMFADMPTEGGADLVVDAIFGTGLSRPVSEDVLGAWEAATAPPGAARPSSVALDCPSGFDVDRGTWLGGDRNRMSPDLCVTFHAPKVGHYLAPCAAASPRVVDIGLGKWRRDGAALAGSDARTRLVAPETNLRAWLSESSRCLAGEHKYDRGHALVLGGGVGHGGAARMAARGALRAGAGLVTLAPPPEAIAENAARLDAVMLAPCADAAALADLLEDDRISALCLGPGLGVGARTRALVQTALSFERRIVLDADGLTSFADDPDDLFGRLHGGVVLTPHEGEFARLFPDLGIASRAESGLSKLDAAREAAVRSGAVVLLKGETTVIARPDGIAALHPAIYDRAAPQLATAGAGDVLAGIILGLISPGAVPIGPAVELAVWLHVECARRFGPGLIAEDLPEQLPAVLRAMT